MATFDVSTTIKRPVEDVFIVLSNVENNPKWSSVPAEPAHSADSDPFLLEDKTLIDGRLSPLVRE